MWTSRGNQREQGLVILKNGASPKRLPNHEGARIHCFPKHMETRLRENRKQEVTRFVYSRKVQVVALRLIRLYF